MCKPDSLLNKSAIIKLNDAWHNVQLAHSISHPHAFLWGEMTQTIIALFLGL